MSETVCGACGRTLPDDIVACPGCAAREAQLRYRERERRNRQEHRARLGLRPLTRARHLAHWALVSAEESLADVVEHADALGLPEAASARHALQLVYRARRAVEGTGTARQAPPKGLASAAAAAAD